MIEADVLVVGGSLVGLSVAALLGRHDVRCTVVERHRGTAIHPRAGHFHLRTLEAFRSAGLEPAVRATSEEQFDPDGGINAVESLAGKEIATYIANLNEGVSQFSPSRRLFVTQQSLEPLLRERAAELGAELHYATELVSFDQDEQGVTAVIRSVDTGQEVRVRARYLIAADGNRSTIRDRLGIPMVGHGQLSHSVTIYFRADCAQILRGRNLGVIYVKNPELRGFFRMVRSGQAGFLVVNTVGDVSQPEAHNVADSITTERAEELVRSAIGVPHMPIQIEDIARWRAVADVADRYANGRVFLIGDAAHVVPPTGGFGGNTGVQDAHNLAWKLALVLKGVAGPGLLATYDAERRPIGGLTIEQAYTRYVLRIWPERGTEGMQPLVDDLSMEIGYLYRSHAIAVEPGDDGALYENPRRANGRPGSRAPHMMLERSGKPVSVLDLAERNLVLLAGPAGDAWCELAHDAARDFGVALDVHRLDRTGAVADPAGCFVERYGITPSGAVLLRPDGFIAWRAVSAESASRQAIEAALSMVLCTPVTTNHRNQCLTRFPTNRTQRDTT